MNSFVKENEVLNLNTSDSEAESISNCNLEEPLQNNILMMELREKIFQYLDLPSLLQCRLVCKTWKDEIFHTRFPRSLYVRYRPEDLYYHTAQFPSASKLLSMGLRSETQIFEAAEYINNAEISSRLLPSRHLWVSKAENESVDLFKELYPLFETFGEHVTTLEFFAGTMSYSLFLFLPQLCPKLKTLSINIDEKCATILGKSGKVFIPKNLQNSWKRPFPLLKQLVIELKDTRITQSGVESIKTVVEFLLSRISRDVSLCIVASKSEPNTTDRISSEISSSSEIMKRLTDLYVMDSKNMSEGWWRFSALKWLLIEDVDDLPENAFSNLWKATSETLESLQIIHCEPLVLKFPCQMKRLRELYITGSVRTVALREESERSISIFGLFPKIRDILFDVAIENSPMNILIEQLFPETIRRVVIPSPVMYDEVQTFHIPGFVNDSRIVDRLKIGFKNISSLGIGINEYFLKLLLEELKDLPVKHLNLEYQQKYRPLLTFYSELTGISKSDCSRIMEEKSLDNFEDGLVVEPSLSDWKSLQVLQLTYTAYDTNYAPLKWIAISQCLKMLPKLKGLQLCSFVIEDAILRQIPKTLQLTELRMSYSEVNKGLERDLQQEHPAIKFQF